MVDYPFKSMPVADPHTFARAANAAVTIYAATDTANATPLALKDSTGLPLPNPMTTTALAYLQPFIAPVPDIKFVGGGLVVFESSPEGLRNEAVEASAAAESAAAEAELAASNTVTSAAVVAGDLVLTKASGATVVAGNVTGPAGPKGADGSNVVPTKQAVEEVVHQFTATTSSTAADVTAWLAVPYKGVKRLTGTLNITAPIVIPSNTHLDATGAAITSTHVGHMIRNTNHASTTTRDSNITITGGVWQRNAGGQPGAGAKGDANASHSIFLRHVDNLIVRDMLVGSTGGKYMIALGDVTNFHVADITTASVHSDTVHITGPANAGVIERVRTMSGGDDVVAFTTTDYTGYNDVSGTIQNITVRDVVANNATRAVLIAGGGDPTVGADGFNVTDITVDGVTQLGAGVTIGTGHPFAVNETIDRITINRPKGGRLDFKAPNHGTITINGAHSSTSLAVLSPEAGQTKNRIERLNIQNTVITAGSAVSAANAMSSIGALTIDGVTSTGGVLVDAACASIENVRIRNTKQNGTSQMLSLAGAIVIDSLVINAVTASYPNDRSMIQIGGTANVKRASINDSVITGTGVANNHVAYVAGTTSKLGVISINRADITGVARVVEVASGSTAAVTLNISESALTNINRLVQAGGGRVDVKYSNITLTGTINQPLRFYNSAASTITGQGWLGYTSGALAADVGTVRVRADLPADLALLAKNNGDMAHNTNTGLAAGAGLAVSNGTNWKNLYSGATY